MAIEQTPFQRAPRALRVHDAARAQEHRREANRAVAVSAMGVAVTVALALAVGWIRRVRWIARQQAA